MSMSNLKTTIVPFHEHELITVKDGGIIRVAMKPICEALGLDWKSQHSRIQRNPVLASTMVMMTMVAGDEKQRDMLTLPIEMLHGWLFGIEVSRVKEHLRPMLMTYQRECYQALDGYFRRGRKIATAKPLSGSQLLAAQRHVQKLLADFKRERDPATRQTLMEMLDQSCRLIGINPPALSVLQ